MARVSPLVNDSPLCFVAFLIVSARKTVVGLPYLLSWTTFPLRRVHDGNIYPPSSCWRHADDVLIVLPHDWTYTYFPSTLVVRAQFSSVDAYFPRFWAYLLPLTWSARVLALGRTALKAPHYP